MDAIYTKSSLFSASAFVILAGMVLALFRLHMCGNLWTLLFGRYAESHIFFFHRRRFLMGILCASMKKGPFDILVGMGGT